MDVELVVLAFTGCDSFDLKLSGDGLDLLLKLYICGRYVSIYVLEACKDWSVHTVHSLQRPPAKSQRPRQPLGWLLQENILVDLCDEVVKIEVWM